MGLVRTFPKNVLVEFDPTPTPKGLSAKQNRIPEVYIRERLLNFFTSKGSNPKHGDAALRLPISTRFFKDPAKGRQYIEQLAKQCGCNAVLGLEFEKKTFSEGNYRFTGHAFKGELALVTEKQPCDTKEMALAAERQLQQRIQAAEQAFGRYKRLSLRLDRASFPAASAAPSPCLLWWQSCQRRLSPV